MKLLLAGDSTVTEQPRAQGFDPKTTYCGWGQMLHHFLQPGVPVHNFADSGLTVETFRTGGYYDKLCAALDPGDFVLLQFGHNDQKLAHLRENAGYADGLAAYVHEVRAHGGVPVFVTSVARNSWRGDNGEYNDLLAPYAQAVRTVAARLGAPLLDLHAASAAWVKSLGLHGAKRYFHPGDFTHPNDFGGFAWAKMVAQCIAQSAEPALAPLRAALLPQTSCPAMELPAQAGDAACGWCAPPPTKFAAHAQDGADASENAPITGAQALALARTGFGYFVARDVCAQPPLDALACARENGYLPQTFPQDAAQLARPLPAPQLRALLQLACRGRGRLPVGTVALSPEESPDGAVTQRAATAYAALLEQRALGCEAGAGDTPAPAAFVPAGS